MNYQQTTKEKEGEGSAVDSGCSLFGTESPST